MKRTLVCLAVFAQISGCTSVPVAQVVKVPVPVECRAETPDRPAMPTESLTGTEPLDDHLKAAHAEIELREGYESGLRAALASCKRPPAPIDHAARDGRPLPAGSAGATLGK